jgi:hypothetical protein
MHNEFGSTRGATLTSGTDVIIECRGASNVLALFRGTSGTVAYKVYLSVDGDNYTTTRCFNYKTGAETAADSGITAANDDLYQIPCTGATHVKLSRSSGAGSTLVDAMAAFAGETLADAAVTISGSVTLGAGSALVGAFTPYVALRAVTLTFSTDTGIYADNDVLADSQILASAFRANDAKGFLVGIQLTDEDDNTAIDMDMVFLKANVSLGTENAAVSISDANARNIIHTIHILADDWDDLINSKQVTLGGRNSLMSVPLEPVSGSDDVYVGLIVRSGTPTYTATGLTAIFYFIDAL